MSLSHDMFGGDGIVRSASAMPGAGPAVVQVAAALQQLRQEFSVLWNRYHRLTDSSPISFSQIVSVDETKMTPYKFAEGVRQGSVHSVAEIEARVAAAEVAVGSLDMRTAASADLAAEQAAELKRLREEVQAGASLAAGRAATTDGRLAAAEQHLESWRDEVVSLEGRLGAMVEERMAPLAFAVQDLEAIREDVKGAHDKCGQRFKTFVEFRASVRDSVEAVLRIEANVARFEREMEVKSRDSRALVEKLEGRCEDLRDTTTRGLTQLEASTQRDLERLKAELFLMVSEQPNYARVTEARFFALEQRLKTEENYRISEQTGTDTILGEVVKVVDKQSRKLESKAAKRDVQNLEQILQPLAEQIIQKLLFSSQVYTQIA